MRMFYRFWLWQIDEGVWHTAARGRRVVYLSEYAAVVEGISVETLGSERMGGHSQ